MADWKPGERIGERWEVHRILRGGMGVVYIVYDHEWNEVFAAKSFQQELFAGNPDAKRRFEREAHAWIGLDAHPNVTQARMVHEIDGQPLLFLEYVPGGDLASWIGSPRLTGDPGQVVSFALQLCDGMTHAAAKGIAVHRDLKPQNCLVGQHRTLKITDFGLARVLSAGDAAVSSGVSPAGANPVSPSEVATYAPIQPLSGTGLWAGTPPYMAPEQFLDATRVDVRADVYSFGVMLFEMATGLRPFSGHGWYELQALHEHEPPPRLAGSHVALADVVDRCLAKYPASRFADFAELRAELGAVHETLTGRPAPPPPQVSAYRAEELCNKGLSLHTLRRHDEALRAYEQALSADSRLARAHSNKGVTLGEGLGRWSDALSCFEEALRLKGDDVEAWSNTGMALRALGRPREAVACYDRALALDPREDVVWTNRAVALRELGHLEDARSSLSRALELNPRSAVLWNDHGTALLAMGRAQEALASFDRALELQPFENAWLNKGVALAALGRLEDALACYERALQLNPAYAKAWTSKGNVFTRLDRIREAIACYDRSLQIDPGQANAWYNKGAALLQVDDLERAVECLTRAAGMGHAQARRLLDAAGQG